MTSLRGLTEIYSVLERKARQLPPSPVREDVAAWLQDTASECLDWQRSHLGIGVMGFIAVDPTRRELIRLFGSRPSDRGFNLPYAWGRQIPSDYEDCLNALFAVWRAQESLGEKRKPLSSDKYPPEYLYYLARDNYTGTGRSRGGQRDLLAHLGIHYVPAGEVIYMLMAWRILLRLKGAGGDLRSLYESRGEREFRPAAVASSVWDHTDALSQREQGLQSTLSQSAEPEVLAAWEQIVARYDMLYPEPEGTIRDLANLGVISPIGQDPRDWRPEAGFWYLVAFLRSLTTEAEVLASIGSLERSVRESKAISAHSMMDLIRITVDCFSILVCGGRFARSGLHIDDPLHQLHLFARFPIIPYFYWSALDGEPKCHLTIPLASSPRRQSLIHTAQAGEGPHGMAGFSHAYEAKPQTASGTICCAVLGVRPLHCLDHTTAPIGSPEDDTTRLLCIRDYAMTIAQPVIDEALYGSDLFDTYQRQIFTGLNQRIHSGKTGLLDCRDSIDVAMDLVKGLDVSSQDSVIARELSDAMKAVDRLLSSTEIMLRRGGHRRDKLTLPQEFELHKVLSSVTEYKSDLEIDIPEEFPGWTVYACKDDVEGIFRELLDNTRRYGGVREGLRVKIRAECLPAREDRALPEEAIADGIDVLLVTYEDNGGGIAAQKRARIFDRGFSEKSSGVGLSLIRDALRTPFAALSDLGERERLRNFSSHIWYDGENGARFRFLLALDPLKYKGPDIVGGRHESQASSSR